MTGQQVELGDVGGETADPDDTDSVSDSDAGDASVDDEPADATPAETQGESDGEPSVPDEINAYTYTATLYAPLFYASKEGSVIETDPVISATALMHALGYEYYELGRAFALAGDAATTPDYSHLTELPFFTSELAPIGDCEVDERTFRTVSYLTERAVVSQDKNACKFLTGGRSGSPMPRSFEGKRAGWHKVRKFLGIGAGQEFTFTLWAPPDHEPPERLGFRAGINRTGEFRATRDAEPAETVTVNQYLLQSVYDIDEQQVYELIDHATDYERGTDVRTNRFIAVDADWFGSEIVPTLFTASPQHQ
jgi:CRISPR-associated protein Csc1